MRRIVALLIPSALIVFFALIMLSGSYLKQSFNESDNVPVIIEDITRDVESEDWTSVNKGVVQLENAWEIITARVQFSTEREELKDGKRSIARMKGFIKANDRAGVLSELSEVKEQWADIGKQF